MRKTTSQRATMRRIQEAAPHLKFVAFYHRNEERLNACMKNYADRAFVYVMTAMYEGKEYYLYVGKSKAQYARHLTHLKKFEYENIFLYECEPEQLAECEKAVIRALVPIFNRRDNHEAERIGKLLGIDYDAVQSEEAIQCYLRRYVNYKKMGLFGFALPVALYIALEEEAAKAGCSCGELVHGILEQEVLRRSTLGLDHVQDIETNLVNTEGYGRIHSRSQEQVKHYLHQKDRMPGTVKLGRDWLIPKEMKFPEDRRGQRKVKPEEEQDAGMEVPADGECDYQQ